MGCVGGGREGKKTLCFRLFAEGFLYLLRRGGEKEEKSQERGGVGEKREWRGGVCIGGIFRGVLKGGKRYEMDASMGKGRGGVKRSLAAGN